MKFKKFQKIRESLKEAGSIDESVVSFREYKDAFASATLENMAEEIINTPIDENDIDLIGIACFEDSKIDEASSKGTDIFKNIMGYLKLKGIANKYVKSMVDEAIADMDYARRKAASDNKEETEKLREAHKAKKAAITDRTKTIGDKIDNIASTDYLKKVASKTKITARLKKNEIIIKIASKEEAKELNLRNGELTKDLQSIDGELRDYEKENKEKIEVATKEAAEQIKVKIEDLDSKIKDVQKQITDVDSKISQIGESLVSEADGEKTAEDKGAEKSEKAQAYAELAKLKADKAKLVDELVKQKEAYNSAAETDEYSTESDKEEIQKLVDDAKEYDKKATELGATEEPAEETPADDAEKTPAEETPADDAEKTPAEETPAEETPADDAEKTPAEDAEKTPADDAEEAPGKKESETIQLDIDKKEQELKALEKEAEGSDYGKKQNELEAEIKKLNDLPDDEGKDKARELYKQKNQAMEEYKEGAGKELVTKHAAIENEIRELKEALKKAKEKESAPKKESEAPTAKKSAMTFEEFRTSKTK